MPSRGVTIVKLGGSLAASPALKGWIAALAKCGGCAVIVPGGGPFADAVRVLQPKIGFDDRAAHHMALLAMEQYACALASLNQRLALAPSAAAIRRLLRARRVPIWSPARMVLAAPDIPWSWDVTSDSLSAWLARRIGAERLLLAKPIDLPAPSIRIDALVTRGLVDPAFPRFLAASSATASIVGPNDAAAAAVAIRNGRAAGARIVL